MIKLIELVFGIMIKSENSETFIERIMDLEEDTQSDLQKIVKHSLNIIDGIEVEGDESFSSENTPQRNIDESKFMGNKQDYIQSSHQSMGRMSRLHTVKDEARKSSHDLYHIEIPAYNNDKFGSAQSKSSRKQGYDDILSPEKFNKMEAEFALQRETEKVNELMSQLLNKDKDVTRMRTTVEKYEQENKQMINESEELKIENADLKSQIIIYEEKIQQFQDQRYERVNSQIGSIKDLEIELDQKNQKIRELQKEKLLIEKRSEEECEAIRDELDIEKEKIIQLQKNEAVIDVYKKKIEEMAQLKTDLKEQIDKNSRLTDKIELLEKEKENNKNYLDAIKMLKEELSQTKDKVVSLEISNSKQKHEIKDLKTDKNSYEQKISFNHQRIEQLEKELKGAQNELRGYKNNLVREEGALLPESMQADMREKLKVLEKENAILKQDLANKFDKEKIFMENKLEDKEREKMQLTENYQFMEERMKQLEQKLQSEVYNGNVFNQEKLNEVNDELKEIMDERNQYCLKASKLEVQLQKLQEEYDELKLENQELLKQNKKYQDEKSQLYEQLMKEKVVLIKVQGDFSLIEREKQQLENEVEKLKQQEKLKVQEIQLLQDQVKEGGSQNTKQEEILAQIMKKSDELLVNSQVSEYKLQVREKDDQIKALERQIEQITQEKDIEIEKISTQLSAQKRDMNKKIQDKEREVKIAKDLKAGSQRYMDNIRKESMIMASLVHSLGYEVYQNQIQK